MPNLLQIVLERICLPSTKEQKWLLPKLLVIGAAFMWVIMLVGCNCHIWNEFN